MRIPFPVDEYRAAVEAETTARDIAFLDAPDVVCGKPVRKMTIPDVIMLDGLASPFVCGGRQPTPDDVVTFLWVMNPKRTRSRFKQWMFSRSCRGMSYGKAVIAIREIVDEAFLDAPGGGSGERMTYYSWVATLVDRFAFEYGWTRSEVLSVPLAQLFQLLKALTRRNNPKAVFFNKSMEIRAKWLEEVNRN